MSFWKPGTAFPGAEMEGDRDIQAEGGLKYVFNPNQNSTLDIQRQNLPIFKQSNKKKKKIKLKITKEVHYFMRWKIIKLLLWLLKQVQENQLVKNFFFFYLFFRNTTIFV